MNNKFLFVLAAAALLLVVVITVVIRDDRTATQPTVPAASASTGHHFDMDAPVENSPAKDY